MRPRNRQRRYREKEDSVATSVVTPERFAQGRTFDEYVRYAGSADNLAREGFGGYFPDAGSFGAARKDNSAVLRERHARARLSDEQTAAVKWLAAQPGGPAKILVISEDWSSDCRRDVPVLARLAEAGGMELRIFNRDGRKILGTRRPDPAAAPDANHDLMLEFMNTKNGGSWASLPVAVVYTRDVRELCRYVEYPDIYRKDRIRGHQQSVRAGESAEQAKERSAREFAALQTSPFFDLWAAAAIDQILSALHEKMVVGG
jgi:Thioredoxin